MIKLGGSVLCTMLISVTVTSAVVASSTPKEEPQPLRCSSPAHTRVTTKVVLDYQESPFPREILVVKKPLRDWEARSLVENSPRSAKYRDALDCILASPDERDSLNGTFGPADSIPRAPRVTVKGGMATLVFNNPNFLRAWIDDPAGRHMALTLQTHGVPAARSATAIADLRGVTVESLKPPPDRFDGRSARWRLLRKDMSEPWSESETLISLKVRPAASESLFLLRRQGVLRYFDQALWLVTRLALLVAALFLAVRMWRAAGSTKVREPANQAVLALLALLALPIGIVLMNPGWRPYTLVREREVQTALTIALLGIPLSVAWLLLRRRQVASGRATTFGILLALGGTVVLLALPAIVEHLSGARGREPPLATGEVGAARSFSVGLLPLTYAAATYVALAGFLWLAVALWPSRVLWPGRQPAPPTASRLLPEIEQEPPPVIGGGVRLPSPRRLLPQILLAFSALFIAAHSIAATLRTIGPWEWPSWRLDQLAGQRGFLSLYYRAHDYAVDLAYQLIDFVPLVAFLALLLVLRARSLVNAHPLFASSLDLWAGAIVFAGLVGSSFGFVLGFPAPLGFVLTAVLVRYAATSRRIEKIARDLGGDNDHGKTLLAHRTELLQRATALERNELELTGLNEKSDDYERDRAALVAEITRLSTSGAVGGGSGLALPAGVDPDEVALALGPRDTPWGNATAALRQGAVLALLPVAYYIYVLITHQHVLSFDNRLGPLRMISAIATEVGFWLGASFVLGFLFAYLRGRNGILKGLTLSAVYTTAVAMSSAIDSGYFSFNFGGNIFRVGILILFLVLLGAGLDLETVRSGGERRTTKALFEHYKLHDVRRIVGYASPVILAAFAVGQQLLTGQAGDAIVEVIRHLPEATGQ